MAIRLRSSFRTLRFFSTTTTTTSSSSSVPILWKPPDDPLSSPCTTTEVEVLSWGRGSAGQLGGGKEETRPYPSPVATLLTLPHSFSLAPIPGCRRLVRGEGLLEVGISCGLFHSSILVDGKLWVWGKGEGGRLGLGHEDPYFVPVLNNRVPEPLRSVALGGVHSVALTTDGHVYTWGYGGFGALGHSVYHRELLPRRVNGDWSGKISHISTSGAHTAAVTDTGEVFTWGRDEGDGRLGLGSGGGPGEGGAFATPSKVDALPVPISAVACGGFFTMALTTDGQLWSWGANSNYELGRGNNITDWLPEPIPGLEDVCITQVASGGYHSLALTDKGEVLSWGHGSHGQLGHPDCRTRKVPEVIEALRNETIVFVECGGSSSAAVTDDGKLYMWGNSRDSQLGFPGIRDSEPLPLEVKFPSDDGYLGSHHVLAVAIGASHAMCLVQREASRCL